MLTELGEYSIISITFLINISHNYANLALSEITLLCLCFTGCSLLAYTSQEFSNAYLYRHTDAGVMYSLLLPAIHMSINFKSLHDNNNQTFNYFQIGCVLFSCLPAIFELLRYKITADDLSSLSYVASLSFILIFAYWFVLLLHKLDLLSFIFICFLLLVHIYLLMSLPTWLPGSFTFGELVVLCQAVSFFLFQCLTTFLSLKIQGGMRTSHQYVTDHDLTIFTYALVASAGLFLLLLWHLACFRGHWSRFYLLFLLISLLLLLPLLLRLMRQNFVVWLLEFVCQSKHSLTLLSLWSLSCCLAVAVVVNYNKTNADDDDDGGDDDDDEHKKSLSHNINLYNEPHLIGNIKYNSNKYNNNKCNDNDNTEAKSKAQSRVRKLFHVLMIVVFVPGYYLNEQLLCLATVVAMVFFLLLEAMRLLDIPPLGGPMRKHLKVFLDHKDSGLVIVTPIYLLIGCSAPLWLSIGRGFSPLLSLVGVVSIGVGDTVASLVGSRVGRMHWKDSQKTIEGTAASIIAQLLAIAPILYFDSTTNHVSISLATAGVVMTSFLEAFTLQVDNLVLPLFMYFVFV